MTNASEKIDMFHFSFTWSRNIKQNNDIFKTRTS